MTIALAMIVRDEAERIVACLEAAKPYIDHWTIVDTGSTDDTPRLIKETLRDIPGNLHHRQWRNFGHNRSQLFSLAKNTADWLLLLDADMRVSIDPDFVPDPAVEAYMVEMGDHNFSWHLPLFVKGDLPWKSVGTVHAYTTLGRATFPPYVNVLTDAIKVNRASSWSVAKAELQAELLEAEYEKNPDDPRTVFYLAQTYRELERPGALAMYQKRVLMGGYGEERFYAAYRGALLLPEWQQRAQALTAAWEMRPTRLEPLHALIQGYNQLGMHWMAYLLCNVNVEPTRDNLFVHRAVWDWGMKFERSIAAWHVGHPEESLALCDDLLANPRLPDNVRERVILNRAYCVPKTDAPPTPVAPVPASS